MSALHARRSYWLAVTLLVFSLIAGASWFFSRAASSPPDSTQPVEPVKAAPSAPRPALAITAEKPQARPLAEQLSANGDIAPWREASIGADVNSLRLAEVRVDVGDSVQKGQVLAVFDTDLVEADRAQARAGLAEAEAALIDASGNADRARAIAPSGAMSKQQVNQYLTAEKTAQARVKAAQALVESQDLRLKHTQVLAPDAGVISVRNATVGAVAAPGMELFRLMLRGRLEWRAEVTAADLTQLKIGLRVRVTLPGGSEAQGTLRQLAPTVDPKTRYAIVYVDLPAGSAARAGMFAQGYFDLAQTEALTVPQEAVVMRDGFAYVLIVGADRRVSLKRVQTGRMVENRMEIREGLLPEQTVAVRGAAFLNDGDLVQISAEGSAASSVNTLPVAR
ncbi:Efflux transporter, RND family, MFP subunit [Candidatus Competibacter denitrificans Run_A_D11]|uniref:Efflux transporter, RND family, MFP subunit n=1 Tax=Candidatus Competibacter denitrificans Run_A_D11 TaxID=1400863 RepID=W6MCP8_9GAMM|nr:efflux RND transporter periplasmic adaptor subunit [Candidatus Competibacter denitrificans]CDI02123.1 Efflux transporter, RND family, MFP subunit [Candidatus Competibacter denitrificans Run_A_D11]